MTPRRTSEMSGAIGRRGLFITATAAVVAGIVVVTIALVGQRSAPVPPASARGTISAPTSSSPSAGSGPSRSQPETTAPSSGADDAGMLAASRPTQIAIPSIGVRSGVISVGKNADGSLAVPQPGPNLDKVAWYRYSPTPGEAGPSVLEGHVDTVQGPSIFFKLGALRPGDKVYVTRADHTTAVFTVNAVRAYPSHADFPRAQIFGTDLSSSTLRLITCSNFDSSIGHYVGNTVVFAHLTGTRTA